jgi:hypothetical protein
MATETILTCPKCGAKNRIDGGRTSAEQPVCGRCGTKLDTTGGESANDDSHPINVSDNTFAEIVACAGD